MVEIANLAIALSYGLILIVVIWALVRHRNWRRLPPEGVVASILTILFVASCGWGHWLHFRAGMSQRWDVTTAIISAMAAVGVLLYAEPMAGTLRAMLNAKKQVTTNQELRRQIDELAYRDSLTGLRNRRFFDEWLGQLFAQQEREPGPISLIMLDLDHFKGINDSYGHQAGDAVLIEVARRLSLGSRHNDIEVRLAGDELVVVCRVPPVAALKAANRLLRAIATAPVRFNDSVIEVSASAGVATAYSGRPAELIRAADSALYAAKDAGRNQVCAEPTAEAYLRLENKVAAAVAAEEIGPWYQPIVSLSTGEVVGAEALARWVVDGVVVYPGRFLPIVEASEQLNAAFCQSQLRQCCQQAKAWEGRWNGYISFNLSPWGLHQEELVDWLGREFEAAGIDPSLIAVETTERLINLPASLKSVLPMVDRSFQALLHSGYGLMLDDFGGPGSGKQLAWMVRSLAPGATSDVRVKFDRVLIEGIHKNDVLRQLTAGLIQMIHSLGDGEGRSGLTVIAEGIEDPEEARVLKEIGCDFGQGFLYGPAVTAKEFEETWMQK